MEMRVWGWLAVGIAVVLVVATGEFRALTRRRSAVLREQLG
jgi:hypothetical protein